MLTKYFCMQFIITTGALVSPGPRQIRIRYELCEVAAGESLSKSAWSRPHEQRRVQLARSQKARRRHSFGEVNYHRKFRMHKIRSIAIRIIHPAIVLSLLLGVATGLASRSSSAQDCRECIVTEGWTCPVPSVTTGGCTCSASGCKKASSEGDWVCDYRTSSGCSCPPLEAFEN